MVRERALLGSVLVVCVAACGTDSQPPGAAPSSEPQPNILLIVADDMGYTERALHRSQTSKAVSLKAALWSPPS